MNRASTKISTAAGRAQMKIVHSFTDDYFAEIDALLD
jgi:hypothetical protein